MGQKISPEATLQTPNYAIKELPSEAAIKEYKAVIKEYILKTRGWDEDQYEIEIEGLSWQKYHNVKNGIVFDVIDKVNRDRKQKEREETGEYSTGAGRSFRVVVDMPSMQVIKEFRQF